MIRRFAYLLGCAAFVVANLTSHTFIPSSAQAEVPVPRGYTEAMQWYRNAAREGDAKAMFYLGLTLEQGLQGEARPGEAFEWYRKSADAGYALAQFKMGIATQFGQPLPADPPAARDWYEKALAQGVLEAGYNLALMLELGDGGPVDRDRAVALYEQSARGGIPDAFLNLGGVYAQGSETGEGQDLVEALKWLLLAERAGLEQGDQLRSDVLDLLTGDQVREAEARAQQWTVEGLN